MKKYATQYVENGKLMGGEIEADNILAAQAIAEFNGKGEEVVGEILHEEEWSEGGYPGAIIPWEIIDACGAASE